MIGINGVDPLNYIVSANVHRRHMTRAQRAMALAMIAPEAEKRGGPADRGKSKILLLYDGAERNAMRVALNKARLVLRVKPLIASEVLAGMMVLDAAYEVDEVKDIRDKALAIEVYTRQAQNIEAERKAVQIRLRAESKAGELLRDREKATGRGDRGEDGQFRQRSSDTTAGPKTLADLGISKDQSSKWQQLADVPDNQFEAALAGPEKPTTTGIIAERTTSSPMIRAIRVPRPSR